MKTKYALLLICPALLVLVAIFIVPLFFLVEKSFECYVPGSLLPSGEHTLENYIGLLKDPYYFSVYWRTVRIAIISTFFVFVLSYPISIFIAARTSKVRGIFLTLVILPMIGGAMIQTMGWFATLMRYGVFNSLLMELHILSEPINFLGSELGVWIGLVQSFLPMMIYPLTSSLLSIDKDIISAARTLGAKRFTVFFKFTLPLSLPGALAGTVLVFIACLTSFVTPSSLGQGKIQVFGTYAYQQAMQVMNWPLSSSFSIFFILIMGIVMVCLNLFMTAIRRRLR